MKCVPARNHPPVGARQGDRVVSVLGAVSVLGFVLDLREKLLRSCTIVVIPPVIEQHMKVARSMCDVVVCNCSDNTIIQRLAQP